METQTKRSFDIYESMGTLNENTCIGSGINHTRRAWRGI